MRLLVCIVIHFSSVCILVISGMKVSHLYLQKGVVDQVKSTCIVVRFKQDKRLHTFDAADLYKGLLAIVSSVSIRECLKGMFLSHFHLGIGVIVDNEGGEVSVQFRDGSTHVYNQESLSLGKLALIEQSKYLPAQSIETSIEVIISSR